MINSSSRNYVKFVSENNINRNLAKSLYSFNYNWLENLIYGCQLSLESVLYKLIDEGYDFSNKEFQKKLDSIRFNQFVLYSTIP